MISDDRRNRFTDRVIVVPIFSGAPPGPTRIPIDQRVGGIPHDSVLFCEEVSSIDHSFLANGPLGSPVPRLLLERVVRGIRRAVGDPNLEPMEPPT